MFLIHASICIVLALLPVVDCQHNHFPNSAVPASVPPTNVEYILLAASNSRNQLPSVLLSTVSSSQASKSTTSANVQLTDFIGRLRQSADGEERHKRWLESELHVIHDVLEQHRQDKYELTRLLRGLLARFNSMEQRLDDVIDEQQRLLPERIQAKEHAGSEHIQSQSPNCSSHFNEFAELLEKKLEVYESNQLDVVEELRRNFTDQNEKVTKQQQSISESLSRVENHLTLSTATSSVKIESLHNAVDELGRELRNSCIAAVPLHFDDAVRRLDASAEFVLHNLSAMSSSFSTDAISNFEQRLIAQFLNLSQLVVNSSSAQLDALNRRGQLTDNNSSDSNLKQIASDINHVLLLLTEASVERKVANDSAQVILASLKKDIQRIILNENVTTSLLSTMAANKEDTFINGSLVNLLQQLSTNLSTCHEVTDSTGVSNLTNFSKSLLDEASELFARQMRQILAHYNGEMSLNITSSLNASLRQATDRIELFVGNLGSDVRDRVVLTENSVLAAISALFVQEQQQNLYWSNISVFLSELELTLNAHGKQLQTVQLPNISHGIVNISAVISDAITVINNTLTDEIHRQSRQLLANLNISNWFQTLNDVLLENTAQCNSRRNETQAFGELLTRLSTINNATAVDLTANLESVREAVNLTVLLLQDQLQTIENMKRNASDLIESSSRLVMNELTDQREETDKISAALVSISAELSAYNELISLAVTESESRRNYTFNRTVQEIRDHIADVVRTIEMRALDSALNFSDGVDRSNSTDLLEDLRAAFVDELDVRQTALQKQIRNCLLEFKTHTDNLTVSVEASINHTRSEHSSFLRQIHSQQRTYFESLDEAMKNASQLVLAAESNIYTQLQTLFDDSEKRRYILEENIIATVKNESSILSQSASMLANNLQAKLGELQLASDSALFNVTSLVTASRAEHGLITSALHNQQENVSRTLTAVETALMSALSSKYLLLRQHLSELDDRLANANVTLTQLFSSLEVIPEMTADFVMPTANASQQLLIELLDVKIPHITAALHELETDHFVHRNMTSVGLNTLKKFAERHQNSTQRIHFAISDMSATVTAAIQQYVGDTVLQNLTSQLTTLGQQVAESSILNELLHTELYNVTTGELNNVTVKLDNIQRQSRQSTADLLSTVINGTDAMLVGLASGHQRLLVTQEQHVQTMDSSMQHMNATLADISFQLRRLPSDLNNLTNAVESVAQLVQQDALLVTYNISAELTRVLKHHYHLHQQQYNSTIENHLRLMEAIETYVENRRDEYENMTIVFQHELEHFSVLVTQKFDENINGVVLPNVTGALSSVENDIKHIGTVFEKLINESQLESKNQLQNFSAELVDYQENLSADLRSFISETVHFYTNASAEVAVESARRMLNPINSSILFNLARIEATTRQQVEDSGRDIVANISQQLIATGQNMTQALNVHESNQNALKDLVENVSLQLNSIDDRVEQSRLEQNQQNSILFSALVGVAADLSEVNRTLSEAIDQYVRDEIEYNEHLSIGLNNVTETVRAAQMIISQNSLDTVRNITSEIQQLDVDGRISASAAVVLATIADLKRHVADSNANGTSLFLTRFDDTFEQLHDRTTEQNITLNKILSAVKGFSSELQNVSLQVSSNVIFNNSAGLGDVHGALKSLNDSLFSNLRFQQSEILSNVTAALQTTSSNIMTTISLDVSRHFDSVVTTKFKTGIQTIVDQFTVVSSLQKKLLDELKTTVNEHAINVSLALDAAQLTYGDRLSVLQLDVADRLQKTGEQLEESMREMETTLQQEIVNNITLGLTSARLAAQLADENQRRLIDSLARNLGDVRTEQTVMHVLQENLEMIARSQLLQLQTLTHVSNETLRTTLARDFDALFNAVKLQNDDLKNMSIALKSGQRTLAIDLSNLKAHQYLVRDSIVSNTTAEIADSRSSQEKLLGTLARNVSTLNSALSDLILNRTNQEIIALENLASDVQNLFSFVNYETILTRNLSILHRSWEQSEFTAIFDRMNESKAALISVIDLRHRSQLDSLSNLSVQLELTEQRRSNHSNRQFLTAANWMADVTDSFAKLGADVDTARTSLVAEVRLAKESVDRIPGELRTQMKNISMSVNASELRQQEKLASVELGLTHQLNFVKNVTTVAVQQTEDNLKGLLIANVSADLLDLRDVVKVSHRGQQDQMRRAFDLVTADLTNIKATQQVANSNQRTVAAAVTGIAERVSVLQELENVTYEMTSAVNERTKNIRKQMTSIRLVGNQTEGRVEIYHNGEWGSVCDDGFNSAAARVVCYSLGFGRIGRTLPPPSRLPSNLPKLILLDDISCTGSEDYITDCRHSEWGEHDCRHLEDVYVSCSQSRPTKAPKG